MTREPGSPDEFSVGDGSYKRAPRDPRRSTFAFQGRPFLRIDDVDGFAPFLMGVVSGGDRWMYAASTGGLVLGRRSPEGFGFAARLIQPFSVARSSDHKYLGRRLFAKLTQSRDKFESKGFNWRLDNRSSAGAE